MKDFNNLPNTPPIVAWEITHACNSACIHCCVDAGKPQSRELNIDQAHELIDDLVENEVFKIIIGGGEPLTRKGFFELVQHAYDGGIHLSLITNGLLVKRDDLPLFNMFDVVQISLDGANSSTNDLQRGVLGATKKTFNVIRLLVEEGVNVRIFTTATRLNFREIPKIYEIAQSLGANEYGVGRLIPVGRGRVNLTTLEPTPQMYRQIIKWLISPRISKGPLKLALGECFTFWTRLCRNKTEENIKLCQGGFSSCVILPNGDVTPCSFFTVRTKRVGGNIKTKNIRTIWLESDLFKKWRLRKLTYGTCFRCNLRNKKCASPCQTIGCWPFDSAITACPP